MNTYCCLSCKKDTRNIDPKVIKTKNDVIKMFYAIIKSIHLWQRLVLQNVFHKDLVYLIV